MEEQFGSFLKIRERVLVCLDRDSDLGRETERIILRYDGVPCFWGGDHRWSTLLRSAFTNKFSAIVADPRLILGLSKLAKQNLIPLYFRNVVLTSECPQWMREGIAGGLDCHVAEGSLTGQYPAEHMSRELAALRDELLKWFSILDCRMCRGESGLEMEIIMFPGKKLPGLPSCAKQVVRPWNRDLDRPFFMDPCFEYNEHFGENH